MVSRTFLLFAFIFLLIGTGGKITIFSGKWEFDESHSSYNLTTNVIKDLPDQSKRMIPNYDVPRLAAIPRYFSTPPILVVKVVGGRLTMSAPKWFTGWIPHDAELLIDGKQRKNNVVGGVYQTISRWEGTRIVREWNERGTGLYESSEGRDTFSLSENGKTLTVECYRIRKLRMNVDNRPYELDDVEEIRSVFTKIP